jgi:hypothetical protein
MKYLIESTWNQDPGLAIEALEESVVKMISEGWQALGPAQLVFCPLDRKHFSGEDGFIAMQTLTRAA